MSLVERAMSYHGPMDSTASRSSARWLLLPVLAVPVLVWVAALPACAEPCLDDGLGQQFCPEAETGAGDGTSSATATSDSNGETGTGDGNIDECPLLDVILIPRVPTVMLLVDQSGSMTGDFGGDTRWNVITDVLVNPNTGVVAQLAGTIRFGLTLYSGVNNGVCPNLIEVAPAIDNFPGIESTLTMQVPLSGTPTGESLDAVWQKLDVLAVPGPKFIVLATDGEPDTCAQPDPSNGQPEAVAAAAAAHAAGIDTFIISVGNDVSAGHLQDMANAGQGVGPGDPDAEFYLALDQAGLIGAFEQIINGVRSCQFDLDVALTPEDAGNCTVEVNGQVVGLDDANGWQLGDPMEIELLGTTCDALQSGTSSVQMTCAC